MLVMARPRFAGLRSDLLQLSETDKHHIEEADQKRRFKGQWLMKKVDDVTEGHRDFRRGHCQDEQANCTHCRAP